MYLAGRELKNKLVRLRDANGRGVDETVIGGAGICLIALLVSLGLPSGRRPATGPRP